MWKEIKKKKIKARVNKDIRKIIESEEVFFKPVRVCNFWNNNYIEYESNGDENKTLSIKQYFHGIKLYLKNIIVNPQ